MPDPNPMLRNRSRARRLALSPYSSSNGCVASIVLLGLIAALPVACSSGGSDRAAVAVDTAAEQARAKNQSIVSGKAPAATGGLAAIVVLAPKDSAPGTSVENAPAAGRPVMDQVSQTFTPPVMFVRTGQAAEFRNSDETLHNIRVRNEDTRESAFNIALPTGQTFEYVFHQDGFYDVGCDIHPAMSAVIVATASPHTALAGADGSFTIEGVPPGRYDLTIYADVRKIDRTIDVTPGRTDLGVVAP